MSNFDESKHQRAADGKFAHKPHSEAGDVNLAGYRELPRLLVAPQVANQTAQTFSRAVEPGVFMSLGATDFQPTIGAHGLGALNFKARILPFNKDGQRDYKPHVMDVTVSHTPEDLIDIDVVDTTTGETHHSEKGLYVDQLNRRLLALDYDGEETTNPRF